MPDYISNPEQYQSDLKLFLEYVSRMRTAQKEYFSTRCRPALAQAKILEGKVDEMLLDFALYQSQRRRIKKMQEQSAEYITKTLFDSSC